MIRVERHKPPGAFKPPPPKLTENDKRLAGAMERTGWAASTVTNDVKAAIKNGLKGLAEYKAKSDVAAIVLNQEGNPDNGEIRTAFYDRGNSISLSVDEGKSILEVLMEKYKGSYKIGMYGPQKTTGELDAVRGFILTPIK